MKDIKGSGPQGMLTRHECMKVTGFSEGYTYRLITAGKLPAYRVGRETYFKREDIDKLLTPIPFIPRALANKMKGEGKKAGKALRLAGAKPAKSAKKGKVKKSSPKARKVKKSSPKVVKAKPAKPAKAKRSTPAKKPSRSPSRTAKAKPAPAKADRVAEDIASVAKMTAEAVG